MEATAAYFSPDSNCHPSLLTVDIPFNLPLVQADPIRLKQILYNLIIDALNLTVSRQIVIQANHDGDYVKFAVFETDPNVSLDKQSTIFESLRAVDIDFQAHRETSLSLSISQKLIELHEGQFEASCEAGKNLEFWFTLPIASHKID